MNGRTIYHLMRADFLQRVRSYSFLAMLLFTIFVTYLFVPAPESIQIAGLQLGGYRAVYNSAWIGSMTTLLMGEFFLLLAFYFLKGTVERDRQTGVGQIIAATPISKRAYILGKWLSNVAVIAAMVAIIIAAAAVLLWIRGEADGLDLWALVSPFLLVLLPALMVIAAAAVLFDSVNWLRGALGNVLFFFIAYPILTLSLDLAGNHIIYPSIYQACAAQFSGCNPTRQIDAGLPPLLGLPTFRYAGVPWTLGVVAGRLGLVVVALLIVLAAAWFFHRFDPARAETRLPKLVLRRRKARPAAVGEAWAAGAARLTPLPAHARAGAWRSYWQLLKAEVKLTFKGRSWLWYLVAAAIVVVSWLLPLDDAHLIVLPLAWVWPLTLWSAMGTREVRHHAEQLVFSAPGALGRQLPVTWVVGVSIALGMGSGVILRCLFAAQWTSLLGVLTGAAFVPALALAMGVWSGGSKLFEGAYLFGWYLAAVVGVPLLDFMARSPDSFASGIPWLYGGLTVLLWGAAAGGRMRQIRR